MWSQHPRRLIIKLVCIYECKFLYSGFRVGRLPERTVTHLDKKLPWSSFTVRIYIYIYIASTNVPTTYFITTVVDVLHLPKCLSVRSADRGDVSRGNNVPQFGLPLSYRMSQAGLQMPCAWLQPCGGTAIVLALLPQTSFPFRKKRQLALCRSALVCVIQTLFDSRATSGIKHLASTYSAGET